MPAPSPPLDLAAALFTLCEDAFFAVAGSARLDVETIRALAAKRATAVQASALGAPVATVDAHGSLSVPVPPRMDVWEPWLLSLCSAMASIAAPRWMPMADVVEAGLSLEHGARGVRSLFTAKPSEKEVLRIRTQSVQAVRALGAVLAATGNFHGDARLVRSSFIASLGLPAEDRRVLDEEAPGAPESLDFLPGPYDAKLSRAIVRGAFHAAMADGVDPREEHVVRTIAGKLGLSTEDMNAAREEARELVDASRDFGEATVDAIRYVLEIEPIEGERFAVAAARLTLSAIRRRDALTAINLGSPVVLSRKYRLDRKQTHAALALAWLAAVHGNPGYARRAELAARHARVADDFGDAEAATEVRASLDRCLEAELCALVDPARGN